MCGDGPGRHLSRRAPAARRPLESPHQLTQLVRGYLWWIVPLLDMACLISPKILSLWLATDSGYWISGLMAFDNNDLLKYVEDARPSLPSSRSEALASLWAVSYVQWLL